MAPYLPGTANPFAGSTTYNPELEKAVSDQRRMERDVRDLKRKHALTTDPAEQKALGKRIRAKQGQIREHTAAHNLARKSNREQLWFSDGKRGTARKVGTVDRSQVKHVLQHELDTATVLARNGHNVTFLPATPKSGKEADVLVDGVRFEMKKTTTRKLNTLSSMTRRARRQSDRIIIDFSGNSNDLAPLLGQLVRDSSRYGFIATWMISNKVLWKLDEQNNWNRGENG